MIVRSRKTRTASELSLSSASISRSDRILCESWEIGGLLMSEEQGDGGALYVFQNAGLSFESHHRGRISGEI